MSNKKCKIVMMTMFRNEASVIKRMLESCLPHVDYYIMQDNGSTDGTTEIAKQFLLDNNLSGEIYFCEEGWKGFGWNRDHLVQYVQKSDHGCDWILKMDCDEILEVDDDFDWSPLDNKNIQAFHIASVNGSSIYYRAWMYNASLPWRYNHDPCHETVYCEIPNIGENFQPYNLSPKFKHIGFNEGQSWSDPLKFALDSLVLEEKLLREGNMLQNMYHFWYIGKSYYDAFHSQAFPLKREHQKEYARRAIFYFQQYINTCLETWQGQAHEMCYTAQMFKGDALKFLEQYEGAIDSYKGAEKFAPERNDHLFSSALLYQELENYEEMLKCTGQMMLPERKNVFPRYIAYIDTSIYNDSPTGRVQQLHQIALDNTIKQKSEKKMLPFYINTNKNKRLFVVDNFYANPDEIRNYALTQVEYKQDLRWYKGYRSTTHFHPVGIKEAFENVIGQKITSFEEGVNGCFQIMTASDPQVYHYDMQKWAAMIYLTPNAPIESGTRLHRAKGNGSIRHKLDNGVDEYFNGNFLDSTKWEIADSVSNIYNRLVIMDAQCIHSAGPYFGDSFENGRLTHLFFFD